MTCTTLFRPLSIFFALTATTLAWAADSSQAPTPRDGLEEIVVTGDKLSRDIMELDTSVQVLDRETIAKEAMDDLYDAMARTANVNASFAKQGRTGGFVIRGISDTGIDNASVASTSPLATIYVDGAPLSTAGNRAGPLDFWDVESVEFFRGPQSTSQGKNALAGAIVFQTRNPEPHWSLQGRERFGQDGYLQHAATLNAPLLGGAALRFSAFNESGDGQVENITRDEDANAFSRRNRRLKLGYTPEYVDALSVVLTLTDAKQRRGQAQLVGDPEQRQSTANDPEYYRADTQLASLDIQWQFSDHWALSLVAGSSRTHYQQFDDYNGDQRPDGTIFNGFDDDTQNLEFRVNYRGATVRGVAGVFLSHYETASELDVMDGNVTNGDPIDVFIQGDTDIDDQQKNRALFGEIDWTFHPSWSLIAGARYDRESLDFVYASDFDLNLAEDAPPGFGDLIGDSFGPSFGLPSDTAGSGNADTTAFLPKLGLRYNGETWNSGIVLQQAYRSGGVSVNFVRGTFNEFDPEYTDNAEWFFRGRWLDHRLRLNSNLYYTRWQDQQVSVQLSEDDPNDAQVENAGESELYGAELELSMQWTASLNTFISAGVAHTEFVEFESSVGDFAGNEFPNAPAYQGAIGLAWRGERGPYLSLDANFVDASFRQPDNNPEELSDDYWILNGRAGWKDKHVDIYVAGRNLTDEFYVSQRAFGYSMAGEARAVTIGIDYLIGNP